MSTSLFDDSCNMYQATTGGFNAQLFQSSADCIKILDLDGRVVDLNPGGVNALELDDPAFLTNKQWSTFWPEETRPTVASAVAAGLSGDRYQFGAFCPTSKGNSRWWDVVVTPIRDADARVAQLMVVSRDVTELYLARVALQEANQRKDEFLALLSHELRNPLSAAGMAATILQTQALAPGRVAEIGKLIERQVGHMSRLAEDLLDISRLNRGDIHFTLLPVDMNEVVLAVLEQLQPTYAAKNQQVQFLRGSDPCLVSGDKTRLVQIVGNLLANAVRYTPQGGSIELTVTRQDASVTLAISDTGLGIAADQIATLFDLYTRVDRAGERHSGGLGIGLALVRNLVELHGGSVSAFSAGMGEGSTFTVELPAAAN
ncbi:MAG: PAS domain-containing sensor histidine kinase [Pseudomonadota bacterium]